MSQTSDVAAGVLVALLCLGAVAGGAGVVAAQDDSVTLATQDGSVTVTHTANATIRGTSSLPAGTELNIRVQSSGDTSPRFLKTTTATVDESGNFSASFDFSELPASGTFTVTVRHDGSTVAEADGEIVEASTEMPSSTTETSSTGTPGFGVVVAVVALAALVGAAVGGRRN